MDKYNVTGPNGEIIARLNSYLAKKQDITDEQLEALFLSHQLRFMLFEAAKNVLDEPLKLKLLARVFDALESEQQKLWNFPVDLTFHRFWDFPGCSCPKMDNNEALGIDRKVVMQDCKIHGW